MINWGISCACILHEMTSSTEKQGDLQIRTCRQKTSRWISRSCTIPCGTDTTTNRPYTRQVWEWQRMIHSGMLVCRTFAKGLLACHLPITMAHGLTLAFSSRLRSIRACLRSRVSKVGTYNPTTSLAHLALQSCKAELNPRVREPA